MNTGHRKIEELATVQTGHQFRGGVQSVDGGEVLAVQMSAVEPGMPIAWAELTAVDTPRGSPNYLEEGDVLLAARGLRYFAVVCDGMPEDAKALVSPHFFVIRLHDHGLLPAFLTWQLNQQPIQTQLNLIAAGGTQRAIPIRDFKSLEVAIAPIEYQRRVLDLQADVTREKLALQALVDDRDRLMAGIASQLVQRAQAQETA